MEAANVRRVRIAINARLGLYRGRVSKSTTLDVPASLNTDWIEREIERLGGEIVSRRRDGTIRVRFSDRADADEFTAAMRDLDLVVDVVAS